MTTSTTTDNTRTITLTDRPPVKIQEHEWPIIAGADGDSYKGDPSRYHQARNQGEMDEWWIRVRQHEDGRAIVYGGYDTGRYGRDDAEDWRGGELLDAGENLAGAIRRVGEAGNIPDQCIRECIADLPAEDL